MTRAEKRKARLEKKLDGLNEQLLLREKNRITGRTIYWKTFFNTICILIVVGAISVLFSTLWMPFIQIYSRDMEPTVKRGEIIMTLKQTAPASGDVIAFYYNGKLLVKRVIAQPEDVVDITEDGIVSVNGEVLDEPYAKNLQLGEGTIKFPYTVPKEQWFVLSDDRSQVLDSRTKAIGSVSEELILGKLALRVWPMPNDPFV